MTGKAADKFDPNGNITREQMWMIMARMSGKLPANMSEARDWAMANNISDGTNHEKAMSRQAVSEKLINGVGGNAIAPDGKASRAQFATILQRFMTQEAA